VHRRTFARQSSSGAILLALSLGPAVARAGRPYVTDDAGVVGRATLQLESWGHLHPTHGEYFMSLAIGPSEELEASATGMVAFTEPEGTTHWSLAGPTLQLKLLGRAPDAGGTPGVAAAVGFVPLLGTGPLAPTDTSLFTYLALTESPFASDVLLFHLNAGVVGSPGERDHGPSWALAAGYGLLQELVVFVEVFSSDPLVEPTAGAGHTGLSYALSEFVAFDVTAGTKLWGESSTEAFATVGVKIVSAPLW